MAEIYQKATKRKNNQLKAVVLWYGLSFAGFISAVFLSRYISAFDLRGAVTFLGIFVFLGGGAVGTFFFFDMESQEIIKEVGSYFQSYLMRERG